MSKYTRLIDVICLDHVTRFLRSEMLYIHYTSAFGTCIQKYVIERYVCLIVFMVIACSSSSYCSLGTPTTWTHVHVVGTTWTCVHSVGTV